MPDTFENPHMYKAPHATPSTVGDQIYVEYYQKQALIEAAKEMYFGQLADVTNMPKHYGKTIKLFHYLPILDDRNVNDQGIDAAGVSTAANFIATGTEGATMVKVASEIQSADPAIQSIYFEGMSEGANAGAAKTAARAICDSKIWAWWNGEMGGTAADAATARTEVEAAGYTIVDHYEANADDSVRYGNLYGSSKDVGTIVGKLPVLSETGGRVNRVGMTRLTLEGTIEKFGFFEEYTQDSLDFDNDSELEMHITTEAVKAANEITEDQLQIDLLNGAGVVRYAGDATSVDTINGAPAATIGDADVVEYDDLVKLGIELDNNRCPKNTRVVTGSRMIDTKVVNAARYMYIGSELKPTLMKMQDYHGEKAFIEIAHYGAATTIARGEVGSVADFRIIIVPEMMHWEGAGAAVATPADETCYWGPDATGAAKINVYPMLVVGDGSFTTIGFQTDGKSVKFRITHKKPGKEIADRHDPYGEVGFYSIKWWYGTMILRPERLACIKTAAYM